MGDQPYSKREQDHYFSDIQVRLKKQDEMLERILAQTTKTNGRVSSLEYWKQAIVWGFGLLVTVTLFVINKIW